jgi:hypothetical protein
MNVKLAICREYGSGAVAGRRQDKPPCSRVGHDSWGKAGFDPDSQAVVIKPSQRIVSVPL